jgi:flagellar hook protein FlgE
MWRSLGQVTFDAAGAQTPPGDLTFPPGATIDGVPVAGVVIDLPASGLTQFSDPNGAIQGSTLQQDGYQSGTLDSVSVGSDGRISGQYTNGRVLPIAQVSVVQFNADNALKRRDGGAYEQTLESGVPLGSLNGTTVIGGTVEQSNTDIAEEFTKMIATQAAYSANTKVVTTAQQLVQEAINMIR